MLWNLSFQKLIPYILTTCTYKYLADETFPRGPYTGLPNSLKLGCSGGWASYPLAEGPMAHGPP